MTDLTTAQDSATNNLPQLEVEIKFYLGQTAQNIIEVGKRLIAAKSLVQHGQWQQWLEKNFQLKDRMAQNFMACAERFGKTHLNADLNQTQLIALLALPDAEETEKFIAEKAAEGKRVADMTIKQLREEIADYKKQLDDAHENYQQSLFDLGEKNKKVIDEQEQKYQQQIADLEQELKDRPTVAPDDYQSTKDELIATKVALARKDDDAKLQADELQCKLDKANTKIKKLEKANERLKRKSYTPPTELPQDACQLFCADIRDGLPQIADNSVDFIITDPPYPKEFLPLYADLSKVAARVLKDSGSLICMTGQSYLPDVIKLLATNLNYHWCCCYSTPGQKTQLWQRRLHTAWKPLLWFVKNNYSGDWIGSDVMQSPQTDKRFHEWGQSLGGMRDIVERFTNTNDVILDPFLGGGATGLASVICKRKFIGVDINAECIEVTQKRITEVFGNE